MQVWLAGSRVEDGGIPGSDSARLAPAIPLAAAGLVAALAKRPRTTLGAEAESVTEGTEFGWDGHAPFLWVRMT
jgi:hypothetical protein